MQKLFVHNYSVPVSFLLNRFLTCHENVLLNGACFQSFCSDWNKGFCIFDKSLLRTIKQVQQHLLMNACLSFAYVCKCKQNVNCINNSFILL